MNKEVFANCWAVILSGGNGTRFWPKSRSKNPKQLLCISDPDKTMLEVTLDRLDPIIPPSRRIIVTNQEQVELTRKVVGDRCKFIIPEPIGRNTAAAVALAAFEVEYQSAGCEQACMLSFHADHHIKSTDDFYASLREATILAQRNFLCLLGIVPSRPATEYGYIKKSSEIDKANLPHSYLVDNFFEKPDLNRAKEYVGSGDFYWNSGIFVWKNSFLLKEISFHIKDLYDSLHSFYTHKRSQKNCFSSHEFKETYSGFDSISIDCALLEKSKHIAVVSSVMQWNDIGSWDALSEVLSTDANGNLSFDEVYYEGTSNTTINVPKKFVAAIGIKDIIVIDSGDSLLLCHKDYAQKVKNIVSYLKDNNKQDLL